MVALAKFGITLILIALVIYLCASTIITYYFQEKKDYWMHMMGVAAKVIQEVNNSKKNKEVTSANESSSDHS